jgi:protein subunit release factor A
MESQKPILSLTAKDFEWQTFCTGGAGGQHRNAKQNGVRCIHHPSGARAEHRDGRDQHRNKQEAFRKCAESPQMQAWLRIETLRRKGVLLEVDRAVDEAMREENLKVEYL